MTREELGQLILSSERQLYATAKTILHKDQDRADAIQESIVKAFSKIHTLKKDCYAKTWLIRILMNECYNIARQDGMKEYLEENYMEISDQSEEKHDYSALYKSVNNLKEELRINADIPIYQVGDTFGLSYASGEDKDGNYSSFDGITVCVDKVQIADDLQLLKDESIPDEWKSAVDQNGKLVENHLSYIKKVMV